MRSNRMRKQISAMLLSVLLAAAPTNVYAAEVQSQDQLQEIDTEEQKKETESTVLSGTCGEKTEWSLDEVTGTLIISGSGAIEELPDSVKSKVITVEIKQGVTRIGDSAFIDCKNLETVHCSAGLLSIGEKAFSNCSNLKEIALPAEVRVIEWLAFLDCGKIEAFTVDEKNPKFSSKDGSLYNKDQTTLIRANAALTEIPECVKTVGDAAFSGEKELEHVTISDSVKTIGYQAFKNCISLKEIELPNSVTKISKKAFLNCKGLEKVILPDGIESIDMELFTDCGSLLDVLIESNGKEYCLEDGSLYTIDKKTLLHAFEKKEWDIPYGVTTVAKGAFAECVKLKTITIPASVEKIEGDEFSACSLLENITVDENNYTYKSVDGSLYTKDGEKLIRAASVKTKIAVPDGVTSIQTSAFSNMPCLEQVTIPASVTGSLSGVFAKCSGLKTIKVAKENSKYSSEDGTLYNKNKTRLIQVSKEQERLYLSKKVTKIDKQAFSNAFGLKQIGICNTNFEEKDLTSFSSIQNTKRIKIFCEKGSAVETTAKKRGIAVASISKYAKNPVLGLKCADYTIDQGVKQVFRVKWKPMSKVTGYEIRYYDTSTKKAKIEKVKGTHKDFQDLKIGTTYEFKVRAYTVKTKTSGKKTTVYSDYSETVTVDL